MLGLRDRFTHLTSRATFSLMSLALVIDEGTTALVGCLKLCGRLTHVADFLANDGASKKDQL